MCRVLWSVLLWLLLLVVLLLVVVVIVTVVADGVVGSVGVVTIVLFLWLLCVVWCLLLRC